MKEQKQNIEIKPKARRSKMPLAFYITTFITTVMTASMQFVYGAEVNKFETAAQETAEGIQGFAQSAAKWLLVIGMVVVGLIFILGSQRQKESAKESIPEKLIGVVLVICAVGVATLVFRWFGLGAK